MVVSADICSNNGAFGNIWGSGVVLMAMGDGQWEVTGGDSGGGSLTD